MIAVMRRHERLMRRVLLSLLLTLVVLQSGSMLHLLQDPDRYPTDVDLALRVQVIGGFVWAGLFLWGAARLCRDSPGSVYRSMWLLGVFIIYDALRMVLFAQADYDRQKQDLQWALVFLVLMTIGSIHMLSRFTGKVGKEKTMEKTIDGCRKSED